MTVPVGDAVLGLYRAACEFTRRVVGVEALERAALEYARSKGFERVSWCAERAQAALDYARSCGWLPGQEARSERERRQVERIAELEGALRETVERLDVEDGFDGSMTTCAAQLLAERLRKVLR